MRGPKGAGATSITLAISLPLAAPRQSGSTAATRAQRELFGKFLADMPAGNAVVLGWYTSERSGVTTATRFGIGTMPADHFMNATVLAGGPHEIRVPQAPERPALENKLYATIFLSDGDNIQYTQHAMRRIWDRSSDVRGQMPLNWTIAPGLVDIAPGIMNYYYSTATPNDCFVCGPSGMGYAMPVNTLEEPGAPLGSALDDEMRMDAYTRLTSRYLAASRFAGGDDLGQLDPDATPLIREELPQPAGRDSAELQGRSHRGVERGE